MLTSFAFPEPTEKNILPHTLKKFVELLCKYSDIRTMDLVEKDLLLHFLLKRISNNEYLRENLIFKGGTCLIKAYFGYYRFSEDLDFTWKDQVCFSGKSGKQQRKILKEIINDIGATFKDIASELNMHFVPDKSDRKYVELGGSNRMLTFKIWYDSGVPNRTGFIKIQINFIETVLFQPVERSLKNHLIEYIPKEKLIEINIDGGNKKELLTIIRYHFDEINKSIKKVKITKEIPCNCSINCPHKFDYEQLLNAENRGKKTVDCPESWNEVPVSLLLDGYENKVDRMKEMADDRGTTVVVNPHIEVKPEINSHIEVKSDINVETNIDIDLKVDLPAIQSDFEDFKDILIELNPKFEKKLNEIGDSLDEVSADSDKEKFNKPLNKLGRFLGKLGDEKSDYSKIISRSKKGIEMAQKLGKTYNKFAQWIPALPVVPDLFLGK